MTRTTSHKDDMHLLPEHRLRSGRESRSRSSTEERRLLYFTVSEREGKPEQELNGRTAITLFHSL